MMFLSSLLVYCALQLTGVQAIPKPRTITALTAAQIEQYTPFTHFAGAGSCGPAATKSWTCGVHCSAHPGFVTTASGGDGVTVQFWYVGFDPALKAVIVGHQGTDPKKVVPLLNDAFIPKGALDSNLFPGVPKGVEVHDGFKEAHADSAADVLAAVKTTMSAHSTNKIVVAGWSLGAAISLLDGVHLHLTLPQADVSVYGYGMPRVGNADWANFVDKVMPGKVTRVTHQDDPVPILPGKFLGFHHVSGERHIKDDDSWVFCSGQDNSDDQCSTGQVGNVLQASVPDHFGPYNGIFLTCSGSA
ncbi:alpha/beta-hydrolase [Flagelloscypha sp. PMI_526]|nr:alpha/beta-hydrolase [Flagelloscypha sp. PMI_526]